MVKKKHFHFRLSHFDKFEHEKMNSVWSLMCAVCATLDARQIEEIPERHLHKCHYRIWHMFFHYKSISISKSLRHEVSAVTFIQQNNRFLIWHFVPLFFIRIKKNAWSGKQIEPKNEKKTCRLTDYCELTIEPLVSDAGHLLVVRLEQRLYLPGSNEWFFILFLQFLHDVNDVITGNATKTLRRDLIDNRMYFMKINIHETVSSKQLRSLNADRRKCYFYDETPLKYFDIYTENLCRIECRIDVAIKWCKCVPFFYSVGNFKFISRTFCRMFFFCFEKCSCCSFNRIIVWGVRCSRHALFGFG